jgi:hypothetical protein
MMRKREQEEDLKIEKRKRPSPTFLQIPEEDEELKYLEPWYFKHRHKMVAFRHITQVDVDECKRYFDKDIEKGYFHMIDEMPTKDLRKIGYLWRSHSQKRKISIDLSVLEPIELYGYHPCVGSVLFRPDILEVMYLIDHNEEAKEAMERCSKLYLTTTTWPVGCNKVSECCVGNNHRAVTLLYFIED